MGTSIHLHFDHCSNIDLFEDVPIYISKKEWDFLVGGESLKDTDYYQPLKKYAKNLKIYKFNNESKISENVYIIPTPGHTIGSSSLWFYRGNRKVIVTGDSIKSFLDFTSNICEEKSYNKKNAERTKKMIKNSFDIIIPGHQSQIVDGKITKSSVALNYF